MDYNTVVSKKIRVRLNSQKNKMKLEGRVNDHGVIMQPYRYVVGIGERHFRSFMKEIGRLCDLYPWVKSRHIRFIMHELILNSQFSMMREVVKKVPARKKVAAYFHVTIFVCNGFFSASIEEYGDFFDYFGHIFRSKRDRYLDGCYDEMCGEALSLEKITEGKEKLFLDRNGMIRIGDMPNEIGLEVIENATDHDFYVTSFYRNKKYMWKRIYFRIEN
jgi:hypothetical protein